MPFDEVPSPDERARAMGRLREVQQRARRRRRARAGVLAAATGIAVLVAIVVPLSLSGSHPQTVQVVGGNTTTTAKAPPSTTTTTAPTTTAPSTTTTTTETAESLPISVESDTQMKANGNDGPTSSILVPASCTLQGSTVTATGGYEGGLAPEVYPRSGDVVELYVYSAPVTGYSQGIQLATLSSEKAPSIGGRGTWKVSVPIDASLGQPARCQIAAQPTHNTQLAP